MKNDIETFTLVYVHRDGREESTDVSDLNLKEIKNHVQGEVMFSHSIKSAYLITIDENGKRNRILL